MEAEAPSVRTEGGGSRGDPASLPPTIAARKGASVLLGRHRDLGGPAGGGGGAQHGIRAEFPRDRGRGHGPDDMPSDPCGVSTGPDDMPSDASLPQPTSGDARCGGGKEEVHLGWSTD